MQICLFMLIDTHCHLNFQSFDGKVEEVVKSANEAGVKSIVVPGTDIETSKKAVEIASKNKGIYAAVGIHPHHVFEIYSKVAGPVSETFPSDARDQRQAGKITTLRGDPFSSTPAELLFSLSEFLKNPKVVAIGEVGIDRHNYEKTRHKDYKVDEEFVGLQKEFFEKQIELAIKHNKALVIHNREAKKEVLDILSKTLFGHSGEGRNPEIKMNINKLDPDFRRDDKSNNDNIRAVFHCCEPDIDLLEFAKAHGMFIGVDGDVVYWGQKQEFIKKVPMDMLVLETDSPFLSPYQKFPNEPKNIPFIGEFIAKLKEIPVKEIKEKTTENARKLFQI